MSSSTLLLSLIERQNSSSTSPAWATEVGAATSGAVAAAGLRKTVPVRFEIGVAPRQLRLVGLVVDLGADLGHRLLDLEAGLGDIGDQRAGERTIGAGLAVERSLAGAGGERDQRTLAGLHLGQAACDADRPRRPGRADFRREGIVAAGIEEHQLHLGIRHGLLEREVDIDRRAELDVHLGFQVGVDRQQIIGAVHRDAVAGIKEQRHIGAFALLAELEQLRRHGVAAEVGALDHVEADVSQHPRHRPGVDRRVRKLRDVLVGGVADHEGDAPVGVRRVAGEQEGRKRHCRDQETHGLSPQIQNHRCIQCDLLHEARM